MQVVMLQALKPKMCQTLLLQ